MLERAGLIIEKIYNLEKPNLYLASFFRFMYENKQEVCPTFVGSVAFYLQDYIYEIAEKEEIQLQKIIQSPIENLVKEHFSQ